MADSGRHSEESRQDDGGRQAYSLLLFLKAEDTQWGLAVAKKEVIL